MKKGSSEWVPPCDCESIPEIKRPTRTQGVRIVNIDKNNQIIFRINSKSQFKCENPDYQPEIMSYQLGDSSRGDQERTLMIYPQLEGSGPQEIHRDHVKIGNQNIFTMKIKKKPDAKEEKSRNIELEVTYPNLPPRIPTPPPTPPPPPSPPPPPVIDTPATDVPEVLDVQPKKVVKDKKKKKGKKKKKKTKLNKRKKK